MAIPLYPSGAIRAIEQRYANAPLSLMERAGAAAAALAVTLVGDRKDVLVLAGPGNNGGDARVVARLLAERFFRVQTVTRMADIPSGRSWGLLVDGLFGIGLARDVEGEHAVLVDWMNAQRCPVLALDVPSGLEADTGRILGRAVRATHTATFIALKPGLLTLDGPDHCGEVRVFDLGLPLAETHPAAAWVASPGLFGNVLKARPRNFHKGLAGTVGILGGAAGMTGAVLLAARAALRLGAGRVRAGFLAEGYPAVDFGAPELMLDHADAVLGTDLDAIVAGPGLGTSDHAETLAGAAIASDIPCVLDADALNLLSESRDLREACARRRSHTVLTPHPAEAARLLGCSTKDVQSDRVQAAKDISSRYAAHVVLKGNGSVIAARDGHWYINTTGNPGMASAGMGDVLAGMLGAMLAQGLGGEAAAVLGAHLHGTAGDDAAAAGAGPVGLAAGELIEPARRRWNSWLG